MDNVIITHPTEHSQFIGAIAGLVHSMPLFQQFEQLLHWHSWVRRATQGEDLPQEDTEGPPG